MTVYGSVVAEFSVALLPGMPAGRRERLITCTDDIRKGFTFSVLVVFMPRLSQVVFFLCKRLSAAFPGCQRT